VLDDEVDTQPAADQALLPTVLSFLSSFPQYLDIVVQCTRKTEVRSWRTLFAYLPPPQELFEESLQRGALKTAGGYLLVLHTFEESQASSQQTVRLLRHAKDEQDWGLCKELARFLMALDESGEALREAMAGMELRSPTEEHNKAFRFDESTLLSPFSSAAASSRNGLVGGGAGRPRRSGSRSPTSNSRSGSRSGRSSISEGR
jgi:RAB6A-GEF complex partner protein 1